MSLSSIDYDQFLTSSAQPSQHTLQLASLSTSEQTVQGSLVTIQSAGNPLGSLQINRGVTVKLIKSQQTQTLNTEGIGIVKQCANITVCTMV
jgi:hypothetical protein